MLALAILFAAQTHAAPAVDTDSAAYQAISAAVVEAKAKSKSVLVVFSSPGWCVPCRVLHHWLDDKAVAAVLKKDFIIVTIDPDDDDGGDDVQATMSKTPGIPLLVVLDGARKKHGEYTGYPDEKADADELLAMLVKSAPHFTAADKKVVVTTLLAHAHAFADDAP